MPTEANIPAEDGKADSPAEGEPIVVVPTPAKPRAKSKKDPVKAGIKAANKRVEDEVKRRTRVVRNFPAAPFEEPLAFARQLFEFGSGGAVRRLSVFSHIGKSPDSGASRQVITNASKYGLLKGNYQSEFLELTAEGLRAVDPDTGGREQWRARMKLAIFDIDIFAKLHERFVNKTLPPKAALVDAAKEFEAGADAAEEAVDTFILNLRFVGLLLTLSGAERVVTQDHALDQVPASGPTTRVNTPSVTTSSNAVITAQHAQFEQTCFYIAPIGGAETDQRKHSDLFLAAFVEPALASFGLQVIRADSIDKPGVITKQIIEYIVRSRLVIVDLSFHNPNVFYELAIRHMMRLPIVQIIRKADNVPFDINQMRTVVIDNTDIYSLVPRIATYQADISSQVRRALENPDEPDTPISTYFPGLKVTLG